MRWKWILAAVAGVIFVLIVATIIVVKSYDYNKFKPQITQLVKDATGRELILGGDLMLDIGFTPSISVNNVSFGNVPWGTRAAFAKVAQLKVAVAVLPLLSGNIEVKHLVLIEPDILIETDSSGKSNLNFKPTTSERDESVTPLLAFKEIRIEKGILKYRDGKTGKIYTLDLDLFKASASTLYSEIRFEFTGRYNDKKLDLTGDIGSTAALIRPGITCAVNLTAKVESTDITIESSIKDVLGFKGWGGTLAAKGPSISELLSIADIEGTPDLGPFDVTTKLTEENGTIAVESIRLQAGKEDLAQIALNGAIENLTKLKGASLDFEVSGKDIAELAALAEQKIPVRGKFSASGKVSDVSVNRYEIDNLKIKLGENAIAGTVGLDLSNTSPALTVALASENIDINPHWVAGEIDFSGKEELSRIGAFRLATKLLGPPEQLKLEQMDLRFGSPERIETSLKGSIDNINKFQGVSFDFSFHGNDISYVEKFTKQTLPIKGPFTISGKAGDVAAKEYKVHELKAVLGDTTINGTVDLVFSQAQPLIAAVFSSPKIILKSPLISNASRKTSNNGRVDLGPLNLYVRIGNLTEKPVLKTIDLKIGSQQLAALHISGAIKDLKLQKGVNLKFNIQGKKLENLKKLTGRPMPVQGPFAISGRINDPSTNRYSFQDLKLTLATNHVIGDFFIDLNGPKPKLKAKLRAQKFFPHQILAPHIITVRSKQKSIDLGPLNLAMTLTGPTKTLSLESINLNFGNEEHIKAKITGAIKQLVKLHGVGIDVFVLGKEARILGQLLGYPIPIQGSFDLTGKVVDTTQKSHKLEILKLDLSGNELQGWMDIKISHGKLEVAADLATKQFNLHPISGINHKIMDRLKRIQDLGPLEVKTRVVRLANKISFEELDVSAGTKQLVQLQVKGLIKDPVAPSGVVLDFSIQGDEVGKLADLVGQEIPLRGSYGFSGRVVGTRKQFIQFEDLQIKFGDNEISGRLDADFTGQSPRVSAELASSKFNIKPVTLEALTPFTEMSDLGPLRLAIKANSLKDDIRVENLDFALGNDEFSAITLTGSINKVRALQGFDVDFSIKGKNLENIHKMWGSELPYEGAFHISGQIADPVPKKYQLSNLDIVWGEFDTKGAVSLDLTSKRPRVTAALTSQKADLRPILMAVKSLKDQKKVPVKKRTKVFSSEPFPLDVLMKLDADIKIRGRQVLFPKLAFDDVTIDFLLKDGGLTVKPFRFAVIGGSADASFALTSVENTPMINFALNMDQFEIGPMLDKLGYKRKIEGTLTSKISLYGQGRSVAEVMAGLNGSTFIMVNDGQVAGNYLNRLEMILGGQFLRLLNPFQAKVDYAKVNCHTSLIQIDDGNADFHSLLDTEQTSIYSLGKINLKTEKLSIRIKPNPKKGFGHSSIGTVSVNFSELSRTMKLSGTLANPSLGLDTRQTTILAGKWAGGFLLGPLGLAAVAATQFTNFSKANYNACLSAIEKTKNLVEVAAEAEAAEAAETGSKDQNEKKPAAEKSGGPLRKLGRSVKGLFK